MPNTESTKLKIPVVIGKNRLRGNSVGAMVHDDFGEDNLARLRKFMAEEARLQGDVEPTPEWLNNTVRGLLELYEKNHQAWEQKKDGTQAFIYECNLPSGRCIFMGEPVILARFNPENIEIDEPQSGLAMGG